MPSWEALGLPTPIKNALGIFLTQLGSRAASSEGCRGQRPPQTYDGGASVQSQFMIQSQQQEGKWDRWKRLQFHLRFKMFY